MDYGEYEKYLRDRSLQLGFLDQFARLLYGVEWNIYSIGSEMCFFPKGGRGLYSANLNLSKPDTWHMSVTELQIAMSHYERDRKRQEL